ncbi:MAG TPA: adenylate/guanylate cyclase domain-containing protein [Candidatus Limnocylindrales bacterium]|nr:adenylate/guanylate cyclase domain-containing protein [Candidatus Limnocylindrales bacterium]
MATTEQPTTTPTASADVDADLVRYLFQTLGVGLAVADLDDWSILFENARFFEWFAATAESDDDLAARVPGLDVGRVRNRLESGRPFTFETEVGSGARAVTLDVLIRRCSLGTGGRDYLVLEAYDASKRKEAEYMLDSYSKLAERNARDLQREKERVEKLLLNIMPRAVYEELKDFGSTTPQRFDEASILMLDFVGFTSMAIARDPASTIAELNDIFSAFDRIVELFGCERMKTIGDAYMAVAGLPDPSPDHAVNLAKVALRFRRYLERRNASHPEQWRCRIGIHTGPVIGSIVGVQKYVYDIFGPGVNLAARMEGLAEPMQIIITDETRALIRDDFICTDLGEVEVKGFGTRRIWSLDQEERGRR